LISSRPSIFPSRFSSLPPASPISSAAPRMRRGPRRRAIPPVARPEREGSSSTTMLRRRGEGSQGAGGQACLSSALLGFAVGRPLLRARDSGGTWQQPLPPVRKHPGDGAFLAAIAPVRVRHHQLPLISYSSSSLV
jgi:hypothetical protein